MGSVPILCVNINVSKDTMLKFDANTDVDAKCERILSVNVTLDFQRTLLLARSLSQTVSMNDTLQVLL